MKNKFAIIGLGQFGMTIAKTLSKKGAEVIAIDKDIDKVEHIKEYVSYAVSLDATDKQALLNQNIEDMDAVIIAIGEDFKSMILCANILTELSIKRIIGRVMGENERLILKKLGISEILSPEDEIGKNITNSLLNPNIVFSLELPDDFLIAEIKSPERKTPLTPSIERIFLINSLLVSVISIISTGPINDTFFPGRNFNEFGLGVASVCTNILWI